MAIPRLHLLIVVVLLGAWFPRETSSLRPDFYAETCPDVEKMVRKAVEKKAYQTFAAVPGTLHLYFQDCFGGSCDASIMIQSLGGPGFDTVMEAKAAVEGIPGCKNKVSCADILAIATRDVIHLAGGPFYRVELGRFDSLASTTASSASANPSMPLSMNTLDDLTTLFGNKGLSRLDMIALSGAHTIGSAHCGKFSNRIYNFSVSSPVDPTLNPKYVAQLRSMCPKDVDPSVMVSFDPVTPKEIRQCLLQKPHQWAGTVDIGPGSVRGQEVQAHYCGLGQEWETFQ